MDSLQEHDWQVAYGPKDDRLHAFYIPALTVSKSFDRQAGYWRSGALSLAAQGVSALIRNGGSMRLLVGAELTEQDVEAIQKGHDIKSRLEAGMLGALQDPADLLERERLEALAWMIARGQLEVKVVVEIDEHGTPLPCGPNEGYFHAKTGVFTDPGGDQVAFSGSVNDSDKAWRKNYENLSVYTSWPRDEADTRAHLRGVVGHFERLWNDGEEDWRAYELPEAVKLELIALAPNDPPQKDPLEQPAPAPPSVDVDQEQRIALRFLRDAPRLIGASGLAAATSTIRPWPHQSRVARTVTSRFPEGFLLCDEVGLGKTIEAGLVLRQLFLDGRVERALVLVPASVLKQFQEELFEKFVLDVPRYHQGVFKYLDGREELPHPDNPWDTKPLFLASSQLAKRGERRAELLAAKPWDLLLVDEAHHARRKEFQNLDAVRENNLLSLLSDLRQHDRVRSMILMTATPLQVHPVEVYDLLHVLGMGGRWGAHHSNFTEFFAELRKEDPFDIDWSFVCGMVRDARQMGVELKEAFAHVARARLGPVEWQQVHDVPDSPTPGHAARKLSREGIEILREMVRQLTPLRTRVQRNTRDLLRKYRERGILKESIATREPKPEWIPFSKDEEELYERVEEYISDFYKRYEAQRKGLGFVMTIYRRRLTSSFHALKMSLERRLEALRGDRDGPLFDDDDLEEAALEFDFDPAQVEDGEDDVHAQEIGYVEQFLSDIANLPTDSKVAQLVKDVGEVFKHRDTVIVFTQYTDTMDYLRDVLKDVYGSQVCCYSGRGGERWDGTLWKPTSKESVKQLFREGDEVKILVGTESMSEGLNLQTCGVLINFDMPWNPMRVEQRIGRIDRIGQKYEKVWIRSYFYEKSVEALVYRRLEDRIDWFEAVVGRLQPILNQVEVAIRDLSMASPEQRKALAAERVKRLRDEVDRLEAEGLDLDAFLDDEPEAEPDAKAPVELEDVQALLLSATETKRHLQRRDDLEGTFVLSLDDELHCVTFDSAVFDEHPSSVRLLSFGEPLLGRLLAGTAEPIPGTSDSGRVIRCMGRLGGDRYWVAYYAPEDDGVRRLETLASLRDALALESTAISAGAVARAKQDLATEVNLVASAARSVREQLAVGELLAAREEGRILLRRATYVDAAHRSKNPESLFEGVSDIQPVFGLLAGNAVKNYAVGAGPPWSPLLRVVGSEEIRVTEADSYFQDMQGKSAKQLQSIAGRLTRRAKELIPKIVDARKHVETSSESATRLRVETTVYR